MGALYRTSNKLRSTEYVRRAAKHLLAVSTTEFVDLTSGIHDLLLARVERVAGRTDFDTEITSSG